MEHRIPPASAPTPSPVPRQEIVMHQRHGYQRAAVVATNASTFVTLFRGFAGMRPLALAAAAALVAACSRSAKPPTAALAAEATHARADNGGLTAAQKQGLAQVRRATARFHDIAVARAAGYTAQYPAGCAQSPAGAQGFHFLKEELVDAQVELLRPELVMYEPRANGSLQLIGVDYVVPFAAWTSDDPPTLLGMPFMRNEPLGVWALHIWAWRPNPSGMFAMWNPKASCEHAQ